MTVTSSSASARLISKGRIQRRGGAIIDLSHTRFPFSAKVPIDRRAT